MSEKQQVGKIEFTTLPRILAELEAKVRIQHHTAQPTASIEFPAGGLVTLTFHAGSEESRRALAADKLCAVLSYHRTYLRDALKYQKLSKAKRAALQEALDNLVASMQAQSLDMDEIWT
jgi:hypothetical protein